MKWKDGIERLMEQHRETWDSIIYAIPHSNSTAYHTEFDNGFGGNEGTPFTIWTEDWVYFCVDYDGSEWVSSIPRNPNTEWRPFHYGGGG